MYWCSFTHTLSDCEMLSVYEQDKAYAENEWDSVFYLYIKYKRKKKPFSIEWIIHCTGCCQTQNPTLAFNIIITSTPGRSNWFTSAEL